MSNIQKLSLKDPNVDLMIIENAYIKKEIREQAKVKRR